MAKDGVLLHAYGIAGDMTKPNTKMGISLPSASGSVVTSSDTGATRTTSIAAIDVTRTETVLVASPKQMSHCALVELADAGHARCFEARRS